MKLNRFTATLFALACATPLFAREVLPFIQDDYGKALVQAKAAHLPIFVEAWAPW